MCQRHLDVPCGKGGEAIAVVRARGAEKFIVPASQHWVVDRVVDERAG